MELGVPHKVPVMVATVGFLPDVQIASNSKLMCGKCSEAAF